jgi:hypothetical protein
MAGSPDPRPTSTAKQPSDPVARLEFKVAVLALDGRCLAHADQRDCSGPLQAHHVLSQQQLRKRGFPERLWDPANGMTVCEGAHSRHTLAVERLTIAAVPARCIRFARELDLEHLLERFYV